MNLIRKAAIMVAIAISAPAFAQSNSYQEINSSNKWCKSYNRIGAGYTNTRLSSDKENEVLIVDGKNHFFQHGFDIEYVHGFSLSKKLPMFIETGLRVDFGFGSQKIDPNRISASTKILKMRMQNIYIAVPVNFAYKIGVSNNVALTPFVGIDLKMNLMTQRKTIGVPDVIIGSDGIPVLDGNIVGNWESLYYTDHSYAFGDKYRYQVGWHVGVGVDIWRFYLGINYGTDFTKAFKEVNASNLAVSVGFNL